MIWDLILASQIQHINEPCTVNRAAMLFQICTPEGYEPMTIEAHLA
jgi:hypothetical protein